MADRPSQLVLAALSRALAEPGGLPLFGSKAAPGLFAATTAGRLAAQRCRDENLLQLVRTECKGRTPVDYFGLTDKGRNHLLGEAHPRQILEDLVRAIEARQAQTAELVTLARHMQTTLDGLRTGAEQVLAQLTSSAAPLGYPVLAGDDRLPSSNASSGAPVHSNGHGAPDWKQSALDFLARREATRPPEDCPLPELFQVAQQAAPELTVGGFHDGLRQLRAEEQIYLHPWTGPLYALPEPPYALLVGHEIAYYASPRRAG